MLIEHQVVRNLVRTSPVAGSSLAGVLRQIARCRRIARRDIARALELSPATVSKAVARLQDIGLVRSEPPRTERPGRPAVPLLWSDDYACLGVSVIDRNGLPSRLVGVATGLDGRAVGPAARHRLDDGARRDGKQLLAQISTFIDSLTSRADLAQREVLGVGVQVGGPVQDGVVRLSPNSGWATEESLWRVQGGGLDVRQGLQRMIRRPVAVDNNVTALAVYESLYGGTSASNFVVVAVFYDRVGAGIVLNGRVWRGHTSMAGEAGHIRVHSERTARECHSGHRGCVEAYSTPASIMSELGELPETAISRIMGEDEREAFSAAGEALGYGLASIINWLNPEKIILYLPELLRSYAWDKAGRSYIDAMRNAVRKGSLPDGADTVIEEQFFSADHMEEICARAAAGLVLEAIVQDVELQEGHAGSPDRRRRPRRRDRGRPQEQRSQDSSRTSGETAGVRRPTE